MNVLPFGFFADVVVECSGTGVDRIILRHNLWSAAFAVAAISVAVLTSVRLYRAERFELVGFAFAALTTINPIPWGSGDADCGYSKYGLSLMSLVVVVVTATLLLLAARFWPGRPRQKPSINDELRK